MTLPVSIFQKAFGFKNMHIERAEIQVRPIQAGGKMHELDIIALKARPFKRCQCLCPVCNKPCVRDGFKQERESEWRASNLNGIPVIIQYRPQRILCKEHGDLNEKLPWTDGTTRFTAAFNDEVAWLVGKLPKTAIAEYLTINWRTVGSCVQASHDRLEPDVSVRIRDNVRRLCVDETSYQKGHKYITVVYDMEKSRVIWVHDGHGYEVFKLFCLEMTEEERSKVEIIAGDGASWIDQCKREFFPNATRCIDFFHVVQWVNKALDDVRISTQAKARREYTKLKNEYIHAEAEAAEAAIKAEQQYQDAVKELGHLPKKGRPSSRKKELLEFIASYEQARAEAAPNETGKPKRKGRPKKDQLSPEHEASLKELGDKLAGFKGAKYALAHNPENRTENQTDKLKLIEAEYPDLYKAYQLKEQIRIILHMKDAKEAGLELDNWFDAVQASGLKPLIDLADKIKEKHKENILNAIKCQANSAKSESTNTTIKMLIRLARGFRNIENMKALIYLKCSDLVIPLLNRVQPTAEEIARKRERANELRKLREERRLKELQLSVG